MAAKDSLVIGNIFSGKQKDKHSPAAVQSDQKERKTRKGVTFATLNKITKLLQALSILFVEFANTIKCVSNILVSLIGLVLIAAVFAFIIKAIWLGKPLPVESMLIPIVRRCFSQIR